MQPQTTRAATTHEELARCAQLAALSQVEQGRRLQIVALRRALLQIDSRMTGAQARAVLQQEIDDHAAELQQVADQARAEQPDRELVQTLAADLVAEIDEHERQEARQRVRAALANTQRRGEHSHA